MSSRAFRNFAAGTLVYTVAVIVWGAFVRATGSGAGCGSHWPVCNGEVIPRAPSVQTLIEYSHRLTSGVSLLLIVAMGIWAFRVHPKGHAVRFWAGASVVFIVLEAALGAGLVLLELVALDASVRRALAMSLHLMNTFFLLYVLTACVFHAWRGDGRVRWHAQGGGLVLATHAVLLLAGSSGAVAALGDTLSQQGVMTPLVVMLVKLRIFHPVLAIAGVVMTGVVMSWAYRIRPQTVKALRWLMAVVAAQLFVGVVNVVLLAPVAVQLLHLLLADALWIALVWLTREVWSQAPSVARSQPQTLIPVGHRPQDGV